MSSTDKPKQSRLSDMQKAACQKAADTLPLIGNWQNRPEGSEYWSNVVSALLASARHGTSDGCPPRGPEPQWRKPTDEDAKSRSQVEVRDYDDKPWEPAELIYVDRRGDGKQVFFAQVGCLQVRWYSFCRIQDAKKEVEPKKCAGVWRDATVADVGRKKAKFSLRGVSTKYSGMLHAVTVTERGTLTFFDENGDGWVGCQVFHPATEGEEQ